MEKNITSITDRGECLDTLGGKACTFVDFIVKCTMLFMHAYCMRKNNYAVLTMQYI